MPSRPSATARAAFWVTLALIGYGSLYPFTGWRDNGVAPWAFLAAPWPRYFTRFDIITNVLAYVPVGALAVLAMHPRLRGTRAVLFATLIGALFSGTMEALQTWLPSRVSSNLDLISNTVGTTAGAVLANWFVEALLDRNPLRNARERWFTADASASLLLVSLWFAVQLYPQAMLFGIGDVLTPLAHLLDADTLHLIELTTFAPEDAAVAEAACAACALAGVMLLLLHHTRNEAPRSALLLATAITAIATRSFAGAIAFGPSTGFSESLLGWATPGARLGLAGGIVLALACSHAPRRVRRLFALGLIASAMLVVNLFPENPYFNATIATWQQGAWINFNGLLRLLAAFWPLAALFHLLRPSAPVDSDSPPIIRTL
jgi:VanZ family protein